MVVLESRPDLLERGEYAAFTGRPDAKFSPAYPLVSAATAVATGNPIAGAQLINVVLGAVAVLLLGAVAYRWFGPAAGVAAASLAAAHPRLVLVPVLLASENLFLPLLAGWLYCAGRWVQEGQHRWALLAGGLMGLATLTRSVAYALWVPLTLAALHAGMPRRRLLQGVVLARVASHGVLAPWTIRNGVQLGAWTPLNTLGGVNLFIGNNPAATGRFVASWKEQLEAAEAGAGEANVVERARRAGQAARRCLPLRQEAVLPAHRQGHDAGSFCLYWL